MQKYSKIGIIGGDMRQAALGRFLSECGYEVAIWGVKDLNHGGAVRCVDWKSAIYKSDAVILPLPSFSNGKYIIESQNGMEPITLSQILSTMPADAILLGGKLDFVVLRAASHHQVKIYDYFEDEMLQIKNGVLTAEAAIEIALRELPISLNGITALVCGYGRIGKILSRLLKNFGSKVFVSARKDEDVAYIEADGNCAVRYGDELLNMVKDAEVVFNTVPAKIIDYAVLNEMTKCKLIIDLASKDGGVDFNAASQREIHCIHALGLPGKTAPLSAGKILGESILNMLVKQGVVPT